MNILIIMIPTSMAVAFVFLLLFIWAAKKGQFDDLTTPAHEILVDDEILDTELLKNQKENKAHKTNSITGVKNVPTTK